MPVVSVNTGRAWARVSVGGKWHLRRDPFSTFCGRFITGEVGEEQSTDPTADQRCRTCELKAMGGGDG